MARHLLLFVFSCSFSLTLPTAEAQVWKEGIRNGFLYTLTNDAWRARRGHAVVGFPKRAQQKRTSQKHPCLGSKNLRELVAYAQGPAPNPSRTFRATSPACPLARTSPALSDAERASGKGDFVSIAWGTPTPSNQHNPLAIGNKNFRLRTYSLRGPAEGRAESTGGPGGTGL